MEAGDQGGLTLTLTLILILTLTLSLSLSLSLSLTLINQAVADGKRRESALLARAEAAEAKG